MYAVPGDKIQFAAPPMIIHSKAESKKSKMSAEEYKWYKEVTIPDMVNQEQKLGAAYLEGLGQDIKEHHITDPAVEASCRNPLGFVVAATTNRSMRRECMLDWTVHFINHLLDGTDGPKQG
jgi:hypothetical protein